MMSTLASFAELASGAAGRGRRARLERAKLAVDATEKSTHLIHASTQHGVLGTHDALPLARVPQSCPAVADSVGPG